MKHLYHIAKNEDWKNAQKTGLYTVGSLHRSFDEDGFIHLSYAPQVNVVADLIYAGIADLQLLTIDPTMLKAKVVEEKADFPAEFFPHLYGPLNIDAVINVSQYELMPNGKFPVISSK